MDAQSTLQGNALGHASMLTSKHLTTGTDDGSRSGKKSLLSPIRGGKSERGGSATRSVRSTPSDKNMNKGLRQISIRLCEKVKEKGKTTYSEVADELAEEFSGQSPHKQGDKAALAKSDAGFSPGAEKNIRRRVYDALNVLFSAGVIQKEKKHIMWRGLPEQLEVQSLEKDKRDIRKRVNEKKGLVRELHEKQRHFEMLLARNRNPEFGSQKRKAEQIKLPFIVVKTKATTQWKKWERRANQPGGDGADLDAGFQGDPDDSVARQRTQFAADTGAEGQGDQYIIYDFSDEFQLQDDNEVLHKMAGSGLLREGGAAEAAETLAFGGPPRKRLTVMPAQIQPKLEQNISGLGVTEVH